MLTVYLNDTVDYVLDNDTYFVANTESLLSGASSLAKKLKSIAMSFDNVQLVNENPVQFKSKFTNVAIFPRQLSLGCKTLLNIVAHPDTVFSLIECGLNAKTAIYNLSSGMVRDDFIHSGDYAFTVLFDNGSYQFKTQHSDEAEQWLEGIEHDCR